MKVLEEQKKIKQMKRKENRAMQQALEEEETRAKQIKR